MRFWKFEKSNLEEILENEITEKEDLDNLDSNNIDLVNNTDADQDNFSDNDNLSSNEDDSLFDNGDELEKDFDETSQSNDSSTSSTSGSENSSSEENTIDEKSDNSSNTGNSQENDSSDSSDELDKDSNETSQSNDSSSSSSTSDSENSSSEENTLDEKSDNSSNTGDSQEKDSSDNNDELEKDFDETSQSNDSSSTSSTSDSENSSGEENTIDEKSDNFSNTGNSQENDSSDNSDELEKDYDEISQSNDSSISSSTSDSENSSSEENTIDEKSDNSNNTGDSQAKDSSDSSDELDKDSNETGNSSDVDNQKEKLQELRDKLDEFSKKKLNLERESLKPDEDISEESLEKDDYELSDQSNKFLEELSSLPSFKDRDRKDGYSIDTSKYSSIPDSLVRTLISKFLNQRFCKRDTDLNIRSNSFSKTHGFHKWEVKDMIVHLETEQLNKVLEDKYGYQYANGVSENVPLSFYFDMSGSMSEYTNMLAVIAIELLKKNVKVLIGFNERVNVQIDKIDKNITIDELVSVLESAGYSGYSYNNSDRFIRNSKVTYKFINRDIDDYLLSKECEKCVVFSDFDPLSEVICLSQKAKVYWFCFENYFTKYDLGRFKGFIYQANSAEDIINGLIKVNENRFETLCFVSNSKTLQRRK